MTTITLPQVTTTGPRCGNRKAHGTEVAHHATVADIRVCFGAPASTPLPLPRPISRTRSFKTSTSIPVREPSSYHPQPQYDIPVGKRGSGYFALELPGDEATDGEPVIHYFRVDRPTEGKWAGRTFVKEQASDTFYPVKGHRAQDILSLIANDPQAAGELYGRTIGQCWKCNRTLTDKASRDRGIGPDCAGLR